MKAAVRTEYGPPDVVRIGEVPEPLPGPRDVLVKVHASTVSRNDCHFRSAKPFFMRFVSGLARPRATILGAEFAGVVEAVGGSVSSFAVGDRVFGHTDDRFGAHAEYLSIPEDGSIATIPEEMTFEQVAPSTDGSHYSLVAINKARIRSGQRVLVNGATGAMGSAAVQLLKPLGAIVTAVCGTEHVELVRGLGADRIIDFKVADFTKDTQRYHVVIDSVGKSSFGRCRRILERRGIFVPSDLGPLSMNPLLALVTPLFGGRRAIFPIPPRHDQAEVMRFKEMMETGAFKPLVDRRYPLEEIVEAYRYVETGQKIGNVVITVA